MYGVKVFTATKARERESLGEEVTNWLRSNPQFQVVDRVVAQSSDSEYHCLSIVLFYEKRADKQVEQGTRVTQPLKRVQGARG